jgi:Glyoxalase-like domain
VSLYFMKVPEPKAGKNRLHLDLVTAGSMQAEVARLTAAGAEVVGVRHDPASLDNPDTWTVMRDPEGHEFCVTSYDVATEDAFYAVTADRSHRFDDLCVAAGREPASIRHSLVCFPPLTPWQSVAYFEDMVGRFRQVGIDEFVLYWPQTWGRLPGEEAVFEEVTAAVMPRLRAGAMTP